MSRHSRLKPELSGGAGPEAIGRRRFLRLAALALGGAAAVGLGGTPAVAQQSKQAANYQNAPNGGQRCAGCTFFNSRNRTCQIVAGEISPNGWCRYYRSKSGY
jgi:hypothetical protein